MSFIPQEITQEETRTVKRIARDVLRQYGPAMGNGRFIEQELFHEGIMGLLEARQNFKQNKGVPWLAFAAFRVRGAMIDFLRKLPQVRLPQETYRKVKELQEASRSLQQEIGHNDPALLAEKLSWTLDEVHKVRQLSPALVGIGDADDDDVDGRPSGLLLVDEATPDPEAATSRKQMAQKVRDCLEKIPDDQNRIILLGRNVEGLKLRDLADMVGCSLENIRLMQKKVEGWMRRCLESDDRGTTSLRPVR